MLTQRFTSDVFHRQITTLFVNRSIVTTEHLEVTVTDTVEIR